MSVTRIYKCTGCNNRIDLEWCCCGDAMESHSRLSGHSPVPMGCTCGYEKPVERIKLVQPGYSEHVRRRFDPHRPKYTNAVKALGAFTRGEQEFEALVSHLDAACAEAVEKPFRESLDER